MITHMSHCNVKKIIIIIIIGYWTLNNNYYYNIANSFKILFILLTGGKCVLTEKNVSRRRYVVTLS